MRDFATNPTPCVNCRKELAIGLFSQVNEDNPRQVKNRLLCGSCSQGWEPTKG